MPKTLKSSLIVELEDTTHKEFKKLCIDNDTSMTEIVRMAVKSWMDEKKKKVVY